MQKPGMLLPTIALSLFAANDSGFVGSGACRACHQSISASYMRSAMGQSLAPASQSAQLALAPAPVKVGRFKVFRRDGSLYQSEIEMDQFGNAIGETVHKLEYVVGSGVNGFGYIVEQNQHLAEAPLSYYAKSKKWDLSPGFESAEHGFDRPIAAACLACHSGRSQPVPRRLGVYLTPPFLEMAIGCENCHGPGGAHAARPAKANIVNPARLPVRETGQVCLGCHQDPAPTPRTTLLAHDSSLRLSKCFQASGGRLTCTTCHDPHSTISKTAAPAHYRTKCLTCHTDESCGLPGHGADCAGCHMAKRPLREIPHTALTSHRISLPL